MAVTFIPQIEHESTLIQEQAYEIYARKRLMLEAVIERLIYLLDQIDGDADFEIDESDFEDCGDFEPTLGWANYINQDCNSFQSMPPYRLMYSQSPNMLITRFFEIPALCRYKGIFL
ncbi:hypothetical protein [Bartonella sp. HY761]|uniref:hypothetical protein n=1 Tax=Bartonella sp. HY761 TaxID=2979330 RepID=UPI0021FD337A|nr:hypothetical protein [Bartonella sp. HY761]UXN05245.1 hypothetical protein N6A79_07905 [Bartonella sp. HY761]